MYFSKQYILLLMLLAASSFCKAQNFTGQWEGIMDDEMLQLNIQQRNNVLCGFSYDSVIAKPGDYCKARFEGQYYAEENAALISGVQFLENSGGHIFMRMKLYRNDGDPQNMLRAKVAAKSFIASFFGPVAEEVILRRKSGRPEISPKMAPCFPSVTKPKVVTPKKISPEKKSNPVAEAVKKDSQFITRSISEVKNTPIDTTIKSLITTRKQTEQGRIVVNTDKINLKLYDNGVVDNDTVSVFYNGKLLVSHQRLSEKPIELNIVLDKNIQIHELTLFAENLGGIPPNTALIVITAGAKRYELRSKANLEENAVLIFEYNNPNPL